MGRPRKVAPPLEDGSLTVTAYIDMDEMRGRVLTIHVDGQRHMIRFGHTQAAAISAALKPNGRDMVMRPNGETYYLKPGELVP